MHTVRINGCVYTVKVTPPNDFPLGLIRSHMVVIHLFLMLCDLQRVVRDLCPTLYIVLNIVLYIILYIVLYIVLYIILYIVLYIILYA
jgi:hypothetical protein